MLSEELNNLLVQLELNDTGTIFSPEDDCNGAGLSFDIKSRFEIYCSLIIKVIYNEKFF
jgi:hypothetical protein